MIIVTGINYVAEKILPTFKRYFIFKESNICLLTDIIVSKSQSDQKLELY